jgi:hypothetical protein
VFRNLRANWKRLRRGVPGRRFQDLHESRKREHGRSRTARVLTLAGAGVLIALGPIVGLIPGPGGILVFAIGVALLARELRPAARALDWCEPKLRAAWHAVKRAWKRSSTAARTGLSLVGVALVGASGYLVLAWMTARF